MRHSSAIRRIVATLILLLTVAGGIARAQARTGSLRVVVVEGTTTPVEGATVTAAGIDAETDAAGVVILGLPPGPVSVTVAKPGYDSIAGRIDVVADSERTLRLVIAAKQGWRGQAAAADRAAIEAQMLMTPGSAVGVLDGLAGVRTQITSPELGFAIARVQGLRGHYTRLLSDGVPLYFDLPGGLAATQIPLLDLRAVELIPGSASSLFGANALAGTINFLARRPGNVPEREMLFSQSAQGATDAAVWIASPQRPQSSWSRTLFVSAHRQSERDSDDDGWSDFAGARRAVARQRVYWNNGKGKMASGVGGATFEKREGGSAFARQELETKQADGALWGQMPFRKYTLAGMASLFVQSRTRDFGDVREHERRQGATLELELRGKAKQHNWAAGLVTDWFAIRTSGASAYLSTRPGLFVRDDVEVSPWLQLSGSVRADHHNIHGFFLSPRGSALVRRGGLSARVTAGRSYFEPTAHTEQTEAAGLTRLSIVGPLDREIGRSVAADIGHETSFSSASLTIFQSRIDHPALVDRDTYTLRTDADPISTHGFAMRGTIKFAPYSVTVLFARTTAEERGGLDVALTPRRTAGVIAAAENERGLLRAEIAYTGIQALDANPYRSTSEPYTTVNLVGEYRVGRWRVFATGANLTDVRQTDWDPIARPARDVDGRWTVDAWAPLGGRVINFGIRASF